MCIARLATVLLIAVSLCAGCAEFRYENTAAVFDRPVGGGDDSLANIWLKTSYLYPARDLLGMVWLSQALGADEAWNLSHDGKVVDGPFFENRDIRRLSVEEVRAGAATPSKPRGPWTVTKAKEAGNTPGFIGKDASGQTFLLKLDHPEYPELGSGAEMIGSRLLWLLGYRVPPLYLVTIEGTGDARYDGKRATASRFVDGDVTGGYKFDHFRMRREVRALRLASAWLNDADRTDNNTLAVVKDGRSLCYQIDFNSCLGSWNGRPKDAWRGWRHAWDVEYQIVGALTLGLLPRLPEAAEIGSSAIGAIASRPNLSARDWRSQNANTAFNRMTERDAAWIARRMATISREQLAAVVAAAEFTRPEDAAAMLEILLARRAWVLRSYGFADMLDCPSEGVATRRAGGSSNPEMDLGCRPDAITVKPIE